MLRKLIKYELKATGRILIPLYCALLIFSIINKVFIGSNFENTNMDLLNGIPAMISIFAYGCTMAAVFIVTFFITIQRFYKNLLGDEGYLMNTLPVPLWKNIASKVSVSIIWNFVSGIIAFLSIIIMAFSVEEVMNFFGELPSFISHLYDSEGINIFVVPIEFIIAFMLTMAVGTTMLYASIAIGHLFNKRRILASFGAFIVLEMASNTILAIIEVNIIRNLISFSQIGIHGIIWLAIIGLLIALVAYFGITSYILKNKLNLE